MKIASLPGVSVALSANVKYSILNDLQPLVQSLTRLYRQQVNTFSAIALAEAGDRDGANELLRQSADKVS